ncbi:MAG: DUF6516 family protein [Nanoarchaeota archaeon]
MRYIVTKAKAILPKQRRLTKNGNIVTICAWAVPRSKDYPEGICYSFQLISDGARILGYDNNTHEGHHRHFIKDGKLMKKAIPFDGLAQLFDQFEKEVLEFEKKFRTKLSK